MVKLFFTIFQLSIVVMLLWQTSVFADKKNLNRQYIALFSNGNLQGWSEKEFKGRSNYKLVTLDGVNVLRAESSHAASGLYKKQKIDLEKTPYLNWRWRVDKTLANVNELSKAGDDFAARIYVVVSDGVLFWQTRALNYVWASSQEKTNTWPNPFAGDHAMMLAMRSSHDKTVTWYYEKRNIRDDFKHLIGQDIAQIDAVAIMTDTDNSGGHAVAYYGDIYFTAE